MSRTDRLLLLDTASLYYRAFYGVPESVRAPDGTPVNAVRGLIDFIARLINDHDPAGLALCWDDDWRPAWRVALVPTYKAHRLRPGTAEEETPEELRPQIPLIRAVAEAVGLTVIGHPGMEADDIIATLTTRAAGPVDIVTGDRDLFALVDDERSVRVLYTARGVSRLDVVTDAVVRERYRVPAASYADLATLRGDSADGLPGVKGIGEKTAARLLAAFTDLDGIIAAAAAEDERIGPAARRRLIEATDEVEAARQAVAMRRDLDLGEVDLGLPAGPVDPTGLAALAEKWGLHSPVRRLGEALAGRQE